MPVELLHTMLRVLDEDRSLSFYRRLGFDEDRRARVGGDTATVIFLRLPGDEARLELTLNDGRTDAYTAGDGFGHIALSISDMDTELAELAEKGITPSRGPYEVRPGGPMIAFLRDPDGYEIELIHRPS